MLNIWCLNASKASVFSTGKPHSNESCSLAGSIQFLGACLFCFCLNRRLITCQVKSRHFGRIDADSFNRQFDIKKFNLISVCFQNIEQTFLDSFRIKPSKAFDSLLLKPSQRDSLSLSLFWLNERSSFWSCHMSPRCSVRLTGPNLGNL